MRFPGRSVVLYIGRGGKYQGVFLKEKFPPSFLRIQDRFLDYLRKYLVGAKLGKIKADSDEFLFEFGFKTDHEENALGFGYKENQLFFTRLEKGLVFTSWNNTQQQANNCLNPMKDFTEGKAAYKNHDYSFDVIDQYLEEELKKVSGKIIQKKKEKFLDRKMKNISNDLHAVKDWKQIEDDLLNDEVEIKEGIEQVIHGQKIKFPSGLNVWQKRDVIFTKVKKLKRAENMLASRLEETKSELEQVQGGDFEFETTKEKAVALLWSFGQTNKSSVGGKYRILDFGLHGISASIGLDAQSNDHLRSQGNKEHYWFHIENIASSHCLVKTEDFSKLTQEDLAIIGSMIRDYSKLEMTEIPMIFSQLKNIKGAKGVQGMVLIKKPRYIRVNYINWKEIITLNAQ